MSIMLLASSFS